MGGPREELSAIAAREVAREAAEDDARRRAIDAARGRASRSEAERERDARRAPTGFHRTMRVFWLGMAQVVACSILLGVWLEGPPMGLTAFLAFQAAWFVVLGLLLVDAWTWRSRLPFELVGYDAIDGADRTDDDMAPILHMRVTVDIAPDADPEPVRTALAILASRVNRDLREDADTASAQTWRLADGLWVEGEGTFSLYTTRLLESWLRRELCLAAAEVAIRRVQVYARYTGRGYALPSD